MHRLPSAVTQYAPHNSMDGHLGPEAEPLTDAGKRYVVREHVGEFIAPALALGAARTLGWGNAWLYGGLVLAIKAASSLILMRVNPAVLNARGTRRPMSKPDRAFFSVFIPAMFAIPVVAGLDVGGAGWSHSSTGALIAGIVLIALGASGVTWALAVNRFFEPTVRLQRDRGHRVCSDGPYRFVRHPGYTGAILATAGVPLLLGSQWCWIPVAILALALIVRTAFEEKMLRAELDGYAAFCSKTRYRLLPYVW